LVVVWLLFAGDVLKLFVPMMAIYHQFVGNHTHALDVSSTKGSCDANASTIFSTTAVSTR